MGKAWGDLLDGGKDSLFLIVVSLAWWIHAREVLKESKVNDAIIDVTWVLDNLISCLAADPARPSPTPQRKRTGTAKDQPSKCLQL
jgi:hypothetical protein